MIPDGPRSLFTHCGLAAATYVLNVACRVHGETGDGLEAARAGEILLHPVGDADADSDDAEEDDDDDGDGDLTETLPAGAHGVSSMMGRILLGATLGAVPAGVKRVFRRALSAALQG